MAWVWVIVGGMGVVAAGVVVWVWRRAGRDNPSW